MLLDQLGLDKALANYHLFHAARADLLRRLNLREEAAGEYRQALGLCQNEAEQHYLRERLGEVVGGEGRLGDIRSQISEVRYQIRA